jgi:hypothetical protein
MNQLMYLVNGWMIVRPLSEERLRLRHHHPPVVVVVVI